MATGERTFGTSSRTVEDNFKPLPAGDYTLKLGATEVRCAEANGPTAKIPYVNVTFDVLGTAKTEGGKNRKHFHRFLVSLAPGSDGIVSLDRTSGLTAFAKCIGSEMEGITIVERESVDAQGAAITQAYLNPAQVCEWLNSLAGAEVKCKLKIKKDEQRGDQNEVARFLPTT